MQEIVIYIQFCGRNPLIYIDLLQKKVVYSYNFYNIRKNRNVCFLRERNTEEYHVLLQSWDELFKQEIGPYNIYYKISNIISSTELSEKLTFPSRQYYLVIKIFFFCGISFSFSRSILTISSGHKIMFFPQHITFSSKF